MSANVEADGTVKQLDRRPGPDENISDEEVRDNSLLGKILLRIFRDVATLKRRWAPRRVDFRGIVSTGTAASPQTVRLAHGMGGPVVWWPVRVAGLGAGSLKFIEELASSTENTLDLSVMFEATLTIRVEEAG